ncbi:MAG: nucleoside-triphosphatase [Planctomycetota bacterium]|jgi:nucleoside-triphosphatase THEP1
MRATPRADRLIFWTGPKHSGKTTAAGELAVRVRDVGMSVAGLLAPAVYEHNQLVGFDAVDLRTGEQVSAASRRKQTSEGGGFRFTQQGRALGKAALDIAAVRSADLVIVDEFGPMELAGKGWRRQVDLLLAQTDAAILLVVREELVREVKRLYREYGGREIGAAGKDSIERVIDILRQRRFARRENDEA